MVGLGRCRATLAEGGSVYDVVVQPSPDPHCIEDLCLMPWGSTEPFLSCLAFSFFPLFFPRGIDGRGVGVAGWACC